MYGRYCIYIHLCYLILLSYGLFSLFYTSFICFLVPCPFLINLSNNIVNIIQLHDILTKVGTLYPTIFNIWADIGYWNYPARNTSFILYNKNPLYTLKLHSTMIWVIPNRESTSKSNSSNSSLDLLLRSRILIHDDLLF